MIRSTRARARRGFTIFELLIASSIATGFAMMVSYALINTSNLAGNTVEIAHMENQSRQVSDIVVRYLRGAAALGECKDPSAGWPADGCNTIEEAGSPFVSASSTGATFYSYGANTQSVDGSGTVLSSAPDKISVTVETAAPDPGNTSSQTQYDLVVRRYPAIAGTTYTNADWSGTPEVLRRTHIAADQNVFWFYDSDGVAIDDTELATSEGLARIALVQFYPSITATVDGEEKRSGLSTVVGIGTDRASAVTAS